MTNSFRTPRSSEVEVFFTDEERLAALAQVHQELLDNEASGALRLAGTRDTANELVGIIDRHRVAPVVPEILRLELSEAQISTLSLARHYAGKSLERAASSTTLLS